MNNMGDPTDNLELKKSSKQPQEEEGKMMRDPTKQILYGNRHHCVQQSIKVTRNKNKNPLPFPSLFLSLILLALINSRSKKYGWVLVSYSTVYTLRSLKTPKII